MVLVNKFTKAMLLWCIKLTKFTCNFRGFYDEIMRLKAFMTEEAERDPVGKFRACGRIPAMADGSRFSGRYTFVRIIYWEMLN